MDPHARLASIRKDYTDVYIRYTSINVYHDQQASVLHSGTGGCPTFPGVVPSVYNPLMQSGVSPCPKCLPKWTKAHKDSELFRSISYFLGELSKGNHLAGSIRTDAADMFSYLSHPTRDSVKPAGFFKADAIRIKDSMLSLLKDILLDGCSVSGPEVKKPQYFAFDFTYSFMKSPALLARGLSQQVAYESGILVAACSKADSIFYEEPDVYPVKSTTVPPSRVLEMVPVFLKDGLSFKEAFDTALALH